MKKWLIVSSFLISSSSFAQGRGAQQQQEAGSRGLPVGGIIEVGGGAALSSTHFYSPCAGECGGSRTTSRNITDGVVRLRFEGLRASELLPNGSSRYRLSFIPMMMLIDADSNGAGDGFGHVVGFDGTTHRVRQVVGALVEAQYTPTGGILNLRSRIARVDYNRERGTVDWRALDATVGVLGSFRVGGSAIINLELDVGGAIGGTHLRNFSELLTALGAAPARSDRFTSSPFAEIRASVVSPRFVLSVMAAGERRFDLTPLTERPVYMGRALSVDSFRVSGALDAEVVLYGNALRQMGTRVSLFANLSGDFDTLTLSNMLFDRMDSNFTQFVGVGGVRVQF